MDIKDKAALDFYATHPKHEDFKKFLAPFKEDIIAVDFEF